MDALQESISKVLGSGSRVDLDRLIDGTYSGFIKPIEVIEQTSNEEERIPLLTDEEVEKKYGKQPFPTFFIFRRLSTNASKQQSPKQNNEQATKKNPPPMQEEIDANNRICEAAYRAVLELYPKLKNT